ncbi:MAG: tRNA guanosine(34) transglycosylase Tgt [Spirochaetales bacterium]|nr:tRNA guanosine(34) transglycosylase Tgt [Spirochaetales bacterium]
MSFKTIYKDKNSKARICTLDLPHGQVTTPMFMPVGTNGSVKAIKHDDVKSAGYNLILGNTYHLYLRPGTEVISKFGGLHDFINWQGNILTDSGGFQIFSLAPFRKIMKEGVKFRSHIDGAYHILTPEKVVRVQEIFNSDIQMVLDVCTPPGITEKKALEAAYITADWAARAKKEWEQTADEYKGLLFGIIQGNFYKDLRKMSAQQINEIDFPGIAIGGLSVGEEYSVFQDYLSYTAEFLPEDKPRYLMGIGTPEYILDAVENGIDIFDCVFPTRIARNGTVFTEHGRVALKNAKYTFDNTPISENCDCVACRNYSKSFLRHMFKANEILGPMLATEHNLVFLRKFMADIQESIKNGTFMEFKRSFLDSYRGE